MIPPLLTVGCDYYTYALENVVLPPPFIIICGFWIGRVLYIYFSEAREAGGCYPYFLVNRFNRFDVLLVLVILAWCLSIAGYAMMLWPQPLPPGCKYLQGQWVVVKHEWECQACCACKNLISGSYYNCVFKDCIAGGVENTDPAELAKLAEARANGDKEFAIDRVSSGDWCWDNDPSKRKHVNNCFERFAKDLDRSGANPLIESNPEDDFPSCMGHCEYKMGTSFYSDNVTTQEESSSPRCMIVCEDPLNPNNLMVDNLETFQASGKTYVESKGPQFKFNHSQPMQEPPQMAVDFFISGTSVCIALIIVFTNCFSHRPRNFITKAKLKKADLASAGAKGKKGTGKGDRTITPEGDTEDEDDDRNPDTALASLAPTEEIPQKIIKNNEAPEEIVPTADELIKGRIAELKAKRAATGGGGPTLALSKKKAWAESAAQAGELSIISPHKVRLTPLDKARQAARGGGGGGGNQVSKLGQNDSDWVSEVPDGMDDDHRQEDDLF